VSGTLIRQAIFYALLCASTGASLPFIPLWLGQKGMTSGEIGWILATPLICRGFSGPFSGIWADTFKKYRTPIAILAVTSALAYGAIVFVTGTPHDRFIPYLVLYAIGYTGLASVTPLLDAMTLQLSRSEKFAFAGARAAGSASFIFANICLGFLIQSTGVDAALAWTVISASAVTMGARFLLPSRDRLDPSLRRHANSTQRVQLSVLLRNRHFWLVLLAVGSLQAAHSYYYAFSTILWARVGLSSSTSGLLWAVAVFSELAFLTFGGPMRQRLGPWKLLMLGAAASVIRWSLMANIADLWLLFPLQLLHALSFVAVYLAGLELVYRVVPDGYEGIGQVINSAYASGVLTGLCTLWAGAYFDRLGGSGYYCMAVLAGLGLMVSIWLYAERRQTLKQTNLTPHEPRA
jgi:PPP family 3-phenylpropionic acid transporter